MTEFKCMYPDDRCYDCPNKDECTKIMNMRLNELKKRLDGIEERQDYHERLNGHGI